MQQLVQPWSAVEAACWTLLLPPVEVAGGDHHRPAPGDHWAVPFVDPAGPAATPDTEVAALVAAVDALVAADPADLPPEVALARAEALCTQAERLRAAVALAVDDVDRRALFTRADAASTRSWLRTQAAGDTGQLQRGRRLAARPLVRAAAGAGQVSTSAADVVCAALDRLPDEVAEDQLVGVLTGAVPDLLSTWLIGVADEHAAALVAVVEEGLAATCSAPADRLEPAFVLLARALPPGQLAAGLREITDAVAPERLEDDAADARAERGLRFRKKRGGAGSQLVVDLVDEDRARLEGDLRATVEAMRRETAAAAELPDEERFGAMGPGTPVEPSTWGDRLAAPAGTPVEGPPPSRSTAQELYDAFVRLCTGGDRRAVEVVVTTTVGALEGRAGVLPGTLVGADGLQPLPASAVRRLGCDGVLSAVLLDAARRPLAASGRHRHATRRERRAVRARQGSLCATNGCPNLWTVPHHVVPYWRSGETALDDLIGACDHCHHDLHDGHRVLRLRDGRLIDELGWVTPGRHAD